MGLLIKPPDWNSCTTNLTGTPSSTAVGTAVTAGASNVDGTAVAALTALAHDVEYLVIGAGAFFLAATNVNALLDVLVDPAGGTSWLTAPLIPQLLVGHSIGITNSAGQSTLYHFPIWVPAGSSIGLRARCSHTATIAGRVQVTAYGNNSNPGSWWCGQTVEAIGITAASSRGTLHTSGATGVYSAWANMGSTLSQNCGALQFGVQGQNTATSASLAFYYEFGVASNRIGPNIEVAYDTTERGWRSDTGIIWKSLPAASQLMTRATSSGAATNIDVAAYAVI